MNLHLSDSDVSCSYRSSDPSVYDHCQGDWEHGGHNAYRNSLTASTADDRLDDFHRPANRSESIISRMLGHDYVELISPSRPYGILCMLAGMFRSTPTKCGSVDLGKARHQVWIDSPRRLFAAWTNRTHETALSRVWNYGKKQEKLIRSLSFENLSVIELRGSVCEWEIGYFLSSLWQRARQQVWKRMWVF